MDKAFKKIFTLLIISLMQRLIILQIGQKIPSIKLATFLRFLAANLGKKLNTQTFRTKKFSFYVAKHKNRHHRGQFNRWYFLAISHSKTVVNKRIKK